MSWARPWIRWGGVREALGGGAALGGGVMQSVCSRTVNPYTKCMRIYGISLRTYHGYGIKTFPIIPVRYHILLSLALLYRFRT